MKEFDFLEKLTGGKWTGLSFLNTYHDGHNRKLRLCEAIAISFSENFVLTLEEIECPGALRSVGFSKSEDLIARHISDETGVVIKDVFRILNVTPRLEHPAKTIRLGKFANPQVYIGYLNPEGAMQLLRRWQMVKRDVLNINLSCFMAVCSTAVAAYTENRMVFSMGCPDSRKHGGISPDMLISAMPGRTAQNLMQETEKCPLMNINVPVADTNLKCFRV